jgi:hypothetical protein
MREAISNSGWDIAVVSVVFVALMFFSFFRLDQVFSASKPGREKPRFSPGRDKDGLETLSDPDGRPADDREGAPFGDKPQRVQDKP